MIRYSDIEKDVRNIAMAAATQERQGRGGMTGLLYVLKVLHVIAVSLERLADHFCGRPQE